MAKNRNLSALINSVSVDTSNNIILSGSRVGFNNTNPSSSLDVSGSGRFTDGLIITGSFILTGSSVAPTAPLGTVSTQLATTEFAYNNANNIITAITTNEGGYIRFHGFKSISNSNTNVIATINTTNEVGSIDGGAMSVRIFGSVANIGSTTNAISGSSNIGVKAFDSSFSIANNNAGSPLRSTVSNNSTVYNGVSSSGLSSINIGTVTASIAANGGSNYSTDIRLNPGFGSGGGGTVSFIAEILWSGYNTPPTIS